MHPKIEFPGQFAPLLIDLAKPLHGVSRRDGQRLPDSTREVSLADGYTLDVGNYEGEEHLAEILEDFSRFMTGVMDVPISKTGFPIRLTRREVEGRPEGASEAHRIQIDADGCEVAAEDVAGLRRAIFTLEEEMLMRRAPILPLEDRTRWTRIRTRIGRSPIAPYRWLSGWELEDENDYYSDAYLNRMAHSGINALWVPGLLRNLVASKTIPELGPGRHRLDKLRKLIAKAARFGIRIYFFCIEPRHLPHGHPAGLAHPEIIGASRSLCTSEPLVRDYIREVMGELFREAPDLAGVINIFSGERYTTCWASDQYVQDCPRCRQRTKSEVLSESLGTFLEGIRSASSDAELIAWAYMMATSTESLPMAPMLEVMKASHPEVIWMGNFEHGSTKELCGREVEVHEYSLSCVGPSEHFRELANAIKQEDRAIYAKLQIGNSYELASVPHIPVPGIVHEKLEVASELGATGAMICWIVGGVPGPMLRAVGESLFEPRRSRHETLLRLAAIEWGEKSASKVVSAWDLFSEAWQLYPFHNAVLYWGPITRAPAYHLHLEKELRLAEPYNMGSNRMRQRQPYEDQWARWIGHYSIDEITSSFRKMAEIWQQGLEKLAEARSESGKNEANERDFAVAKAVRLHCLSTANIYEFYYLRDQLRDGGPSGDLGRVDQMQSVARNELTVAQEVKELIAIDPWIGFQSEIYDFSYSSALIEAKIIQVMGMLATLAQWQRTGVDFAVLSRTVEEVEFARPDHDPDRWGD